MTRRRRAIALILAFLLLQSLVTSPPVAFAANGAYRDPLGLLPAWALEGGTPGNPLDGLLPKDPLAGLLPDVPAPGAPGLPATGDGAAAQTGPQAPAAVSVPAPPAAPDCLCAPGTISVATGSLSLSMTDLTLNGIGQPMPWVRSPI